MVLNLITEKKMLAFIPVKLTGFQKGDIYYLFCSKGVKRTFQEKGGGQD